LTERRLRLRICNRGSFYFNERTGQLLVCRDDSDVQIFMI
jgi:hypothetical protein